MIPIPLSVIIVTKNAASQLDRCLTALHDFDEIIIVDSKSDDDTKAIVEKHNATFITYEWNSQYPKKRQWCLDTLDLKYDWVFFVDADEIITPDLIKEIRTLFNKPPHHAGYFITGQYIWNGQLLKYGLKNKKLALINRHKMHFPEINDLDCPGMGEIEGHYQPVPKNIGTISSLSHPLLHYANHSQQEWLERHKRYAAWEVCMNKKNAWPEDPIRWRQFIKKTLRKNASKPELAFIHSYILKRGILDGAAGLNFAKSRWLYYNMIRKIEAHK